MADIEYLLAKKEDTDYLLEKCGACAYLGTATDTTCTTADTWYPILGTFTNCVFENFEAATAITPGIKYTGSVTQYFQVEYHATIQANSNGTTVHIGFKKNGVFVDCAKMGTFLKTANESQTVSGVCSVELATNDEIQLVLMADGNGDIVNVVHFTTSITKIFN